MSYKSKFSERYKFGKKSESDVLEIIRNYFKRDIIQTTEKFDKYDFTDDKYFYELKSRTNELNKYPTTMIGSSKLNENAILLFKFTDKLAYIEYNKDKFSSYETKKFTKYKIPQDYIYIPINDLILIE